MSNDLSDVAALEEKLNILLECQRRQTSELVGAEKLLAMWRKSGSHHRETSGLEQEVETLTPIVAALTNDIRETEARLLEARARTKATPQPKRSTLRRGAAVWPAAAAAAVEEEEEKEEEEEEESIPAAAAAAASAGRRPRGMAKSESKSTVTTRAQRLSASVAAVKSEMRAESQQLAGLQRLMLAAEDPDQLNRLKEQFDEERKRLSSLGAALGDLQTTFIAEEMELRRREYCQLLDIRCRVCTWNVNGALPGTVDARHLALWLGTDDPDGSRTALGEFADLVVVGFQELEVTAETLIRNARERAAAWRQLLDEQLRPRGYRLVATRLLVGICVVFYARHERVRLLRDVAVDDVGAGIWGKLGNKGGAAVRFRIGQTTVALVNTHLAAGHLLTARRNQDYALVKQKLFEAAGNNNNNNNNNNSSSEDVEDHDLVVWFGDLNYRLDDLSFEEVVMRVQKGDFQGLLQHDQLAAQQRQRLAFVGYREAAIRFGPTYKYDVNSTVFDSSDKRRVPAWCDRVLWRERSTASTNCQCLGYNRIESLASDHRPVYAELVFQCEDLDRRKQEIVRATVIQEALRHIDSLTNAGMPDCQLSATQVELASTHRQLLEVANVGRSPARLSFIAKPDGSICPPWLTVAPIELCLLPETTAHLSFCLRSSSTVEHQQEQGLLEDVLVLHIEDGKDFFISVTARPEVQLQQQQQYLTPGFEQIQTNVLSTMSLPHQTIVIEFLKKTTTAAAAAAAVSQEEEEEELIDF